MKFELNGERFHAISDVDSLDEALLSFPPPLRAHIACRMLDSLTDEDFSVGENGELVSAIKFLAKEIGHLSRRYYAEKDIAD